MAVRIISDGPVEEKRKVCPKCRYELAYTPADVQQRHYTDISGVADTDYWIECPHCQEHVRLTWEQAN